MDAFDEVMTKAGGPANLARLLGEDGPAIVCNWRTRGFPARRCKAIEAITGVSVKRLRPDDWADFWPDPARRGKAKSEVTA
jgi:DNA-binding transcriptional regulator YdaS (Cro superfamily)